LATIWFDQHGGRSSPAKFSFGLLATILLVLLVVPVLYSILDDLGLASVSRANHQQAAADPG